jgi:hypothetical protein
MSRIETINKMRVQIADTGKVLINGDTYSERVYLGDGAAEWQEIDAPDPEIEDAEALEIITGNET